MTRVSLEAIRLRFSKECHMVFAGWLRPDRVLIAAAVVVAGVIACRDTTTPKEFAKAVTTDPSSTMGVGFTSTLIARGNLGTFHIPSHVDGFDVELNSPDNTDIAVANISIATGGSSGWHYHPGPVLVVVKTGAITFYRGDDKNCAGTRYAAGTSFTEKGGSVANARNEGAVEATSVATYFAPPAPSPLRIDAPKPDNCA
jgi:quercetin dioxygenase-like cupin family protein